MRILLLLAMILVLGAAAMAQGAIIVGAPASDEVTIVRMIPVNFLSVERLTEALGGPCLYLFGGTAQPIGVVRDARDAMDNLFNQGRRDRRENPALPDFNTRPMTPTPLMGPMSR